MNRELERSLEILRRTPRVLDLLLRELSEFWTGFNEGPETWSPRQVIAHLSHGERTDWIPRARIILSGSGDPFPPFDRFAHLQEARQNTLPELLDEFARLRKQSLKSLDEMELSAEKMDSAGLHPELGAVTLGQLIATWAAHDLTHLTQISRVMTRQYREQVGPWSAYLGPLQG